jgi:hypothetical protein
VIRSMREDPRDTCPQSAERDQEKQRPHPDDRSTAREIAGYDRWSIEVPG